jgi:hypothetical protein
MPYNKLEVRKIPGQFGYIPGMTIFGHHTVGFPAAIIPKLTGMNQNRQFIYRY